MLACAHNGHCTYVSAVYITRMQGVCGKVCHSSDCNLSGLGTTSVAAAVCGLQHMLENCPKSSGCCFAPPQGELGTAGIYTVSTMHGTAHI